MQLNNDNSFINFIKQKYYNFCFAYCRGTKFKLKNLLLTSLVLLIMTMLFIEGSYLIYTTRGFNLNYVVIFYLPVIISAIFFDITGGLAAALVAVLLISYLVPEIDTNSLENPHSNIVLRITFFGTVGLLVGAASQFFKMHTIDIARRLCRNRISSQLNYQGLEQVFAGLEDKEHYLLYVKLSSLQRYYQDFGRDFAEKLVKEVINNLKLAALNSIKPIAIGHLDFTTLCIITPKYNLSIKEVEYVYSSILQRGYIVENIEVYIDFSLNVLTYPIDGKDLFALIQSAEMKATTLNNLPVAKDPVAFIQETKAKLAEESIYNFYEPIVDLHSYQLVGFKHHLRYDEKTPLPLHYLQSTSIIYDLMSIILKDTIMQIHNTKQPIDIYINLFPCLLNDENFIKQIIDRFIANGVRLETIKHIMPAELLIKNSKNPVFSNSLELLKSFGSKIVVEVEDLTIFFTLLSSSVLVNEVQLSDTLAADIISDTAKQIVIKSYIALCHEKNIKVISPLADTALQLKYFNSVKCDLIYGKLIGEPLPNYKIENFVQEFAADNKP